MTPESDTNPPNENPTSDIPTGNRALLATAAVTSEVLDAALAAHAPAAETTNDAGNLSLRRILLQTAIAMLVLVALVIFGAWFLRAPLTAMATWMVAHMGLMGIFVGVVAADAFAFPVPPDTYLFIAVASSAEVIPVIATVCIASVLSGNLAYFMGPHLKRVPFLGERIERHRMRGEELFARWGGWAVAISSLSPLPYSVTCWFAGIYKMPYVRFTLFTLFRIPRFIGYYLLFKLGWLTG